MEINKLKEAIDKIFDDKSNYEIVPALSQTSEKYDRMKVAEEITRLVSMDIKTQYEGQIEELAQRFIQAIKLAESKIPKAPDEQEIKVIVTDVSDDEKSLLFQLDDLKQKGYYIYTTVQDVHSKGGREAMYIVVCSKIK